MWTTDEMKQLKQELDEARYYLINLAAPEQWHRLLLWEEFEKDPFAWARSAAAKIVEATEFKDDGAWDNRERAPCPLCHDVPSVGWDNLASGWTRSGLADHLEGRGRSSPCTVMAAAFKHRRDAYHERMRQEQVEAQQQELATRRELANKKRAETRARNRASRPHLR